MKTVITLFLKIFFSNNLILLSSPLQVLNFKELLYLKKNIQLNSKDTILFIADNEDDKRYINIPHLIKKLKLKHDILYIKKKKDKFFLYLFAKIRKILFVKFDQIIVGNFDSIINNFFIKISKNSLILDDGTNIFEKCKIKKIKNFNSKFFSFFEKKIFNSHCYIENQFLYLKSVNQKKKTIINTKSKFFILGSPYVNLRYMRQSTYNLILEKIVKKINSKEVFYIPHPKEKYFSIKKIKKIKVLPNKTNVEFFFSNLKFYPKKIFAFSSTSLITLNIISKKFNLINIKPSFKLYKDNFIPNYIKNYYRIKNIVNYLKKNKIPTKKIKL